MLAISVVVFVVGTVAGVMLIRSALRQRRGTTLYCRGCDYDLTGIDRVRCPECGLDIGVESNIVRGHRAIRRSHLLVGIAILGGTAGVLALIGNIALTGVDWYRYLPTPTVLSALESRDDGTAVHAWSEINRRLAAGRLSADYVRALIEQLLSEQAGPTKRVVSREMVNGLGNPRIQGAMTDEQLERFFSNVIRKLTLSVDRPGEAGTPHRIGFHYSVCTPSVGCRVVLRLASLHCGGEEVVRNQLITEAVGYGPGAVTMYQALPGSGRRCVKALVYIEVYEDMHTTSNDGKPQWVSPPQMLTTSTHD